MFKILDKDMQTPARNGLLSLAHGDVLTPAFMPVGTNASVKAMRHEDLENLGVRLILGNSYHLYLRPGVEVIARAGGLHTFMSWPANILTDSGGFQVFSLAPFRRIEEEGIYFKSHIDGSAHRLTAEKVVEIQTLLGSDVLMPLDVCSPDSATKEAAAEAVRLTTLWARQSLHAWHNAIASGRSKGKLFAIIQGNFYKELRTQSAEELLELDFPGYAIGGLSVGEDFELFCDFLQFTAAKLPEEKPRYLMGIGTPAYILEAVENGIDLFDCVYPTRIARNALAFTGTGNLNLRLEQNKFDTRPIDPACTCPVCQRHSRAYLRHLFKAREIQAAVLTTYHNLHFIQKLITDIRQAISHHSFKEFKADFLRKYTSANTISRADG